MRKRGSSKRQVLQRVIRYFIDATGKSEFEMHEVADFAVQALGYPLPEPEDPMEVLARQLSDAARNKIERDPENGKPYRVFHAIPNDKQPNLFTWVDINDAPRSTMRKAFVHRREQMVDDGVQLTYDQMRWNGLHRDEEPIQLSMNLTEDIRERLNAPDKDDRAA